MGCKWAKCWLKCISPPGAPNSSNRNSNRISFILFSPSNLRLLSKFFNCSGTYNANGSPVSFGLSKTSMHFAINFCFCLVGFTRLRLALFSTRDLLESEFNESFCAKQKSFYYISSQGENIFAKTCGIFYKNVLRKKHISSYRII